MKLKKSLSIILFLFFISFYGLQLATIRPEIAVIVNGKDIPADKQINKFKDSVYTYWTMYQQGNSTLSTPFTTLLTAGKYFLHMKILWLHSPVDTTLTQENIILSVIEIPIINNEVVS